MTQVQARYFSSGAQPLTLNANVGSSGNPTVTQSPVAMGWPASYPYVALLDWGNFGSPQQEAILVSNVTGPVAGVYTLVCTRAFDGTTASAHSIPSPVEPSVVHGRVGADDNDQALQRATNTVTWSTGTQAADAATAATWVVTLGAHITALTLAATGFASGVEASLTLYVKQPASGGPYTVTWPTVNWLSGIAPVLNQAPSSVTVITLESLDGGTTWYGTGPAAPLPLPVAYGGTGGNDLQPFQACMGGGTTSAGMAFQVLPVKPPCRVATVAALPAVNSYSSTNQQISQTAAFTFTAATSGSLFTATGSAMTAGTQVTLSVSGGSLPGGFATSTTYFVVNPSGATFQLSATLGGSAITVTSTGSGTQTVNCGVPLAIDGVTLTVNDRVLVANEATASRNGLYYVQIAGTLPAGSSAGAGWVLTRAIDMSDTTPSTIQIPGAMTWVMAGTVNQNSLWAVQGAGPFTLDSSSINWANIA